MAMGRPSDFRQELADEICFRMAEGEVLSQICRDEHMPPRTTVIGWTRTHPDFLAQYLEARERMLDRWSEEIIEISEDGTNDWMEREGAAGRSRVIVDNECVQRSKLRVESRRWLLSKFRPETYGDSQRIDLKGRITMSEKEVDTKLAALLLKAKTGDE